ncbi:hypothetical protein Taro_010778 [Colocasia esculenta]|uniref:Uncharacterized protein n=1 Tax=Colocasia esculenta TaxID=4460 RepID=A0A843TZV1_COLES|nr:hypothetical protein [Colocasia esculenta]
MQNSSMLTGQPSILGQQPVPMLGANVPQYSGLPMQTTNNVTMGHRPLAGWDAGAGQGAPLPPQMHGQMYTVPGFVPPGMGHVLPGNIILSIMALMI